MKILWSALLHRATIKKKERRKKPQGKDIMAPYYIGRRIYMWHIKFNKRPFDVISWLHLYLLYPLAFDDGHKQSRPNAWRFAVTKHLLLKCKCGVCVKNHSEQKSLCQLHFQQRCGVFCHQWTAVRQRYCKKNLHLCYKKWRQFTWKMLQLLGLPDPLPGLCPWTLFGYFPHTLVASSVLPPWLRPWRAATVI